MPIEPLPGLSSELQRIYTEQASILEDLGRGTCPRFLAHLGLSDWTMEEVLVTFTLPDDFRAPSYDPPEVEDTLP